MHEVCYCKSAYVLYNKTLFAIKVSNGDAGNRELGERLQDLCQSDIITEPIYSAPGPPPLSPSLSLLSLPIFSFFGSQRPMWEQ